MGGMAKGGRDFALTMLRSLPRVCLGNLRANPGTLTKVHIPSLFEITSSENSSINLKFVFIFCQCYFKYFGFTPF